MRIVAALGGNALVRRGDPISAETQRENIAGAVRSLVPLLAEHELVLTHGNGPQIGMLLLESEHSTVAPPYPLDVLGAESEGMIGYMLEQAILCERPELRIVTLLTQTVVAADDPAFLQPTKPVGPLYDAAIARYLARERGFVVAPDTGGYRRVVPSPEPLRLLEERPLRLLVDDGVVVIASGGGGVPVTVDDAGRPTGVEGVVDKDLAAVVLARAVAADLLLLLTDVEGVYSDFGTDGAQLLRSLSAEDARALVAGGSLAGGSMRPKVEAAVRFADLGGTTCICQLDQAAAAVAGERGTRVAAATSSAAREP